MTKSLIILIIVMILTGMTDEERERLLEESTNFASEQSNNINVEEIQKTVEIPPADQKEQERLESYKDNPGQITEDGSKALADSGTKDLFINGRSEYSFTENDPLIRTADFTRNSDDTGCTSETTIETGTETEEKSQIETCEVFKNYHIQSCNITREASYNCDFSSNNLYERGGIPQDKVRLDIGCSGEDNLSVTVDAWGGLGNCAGPVTVSIDLNAVSDWTNLTTLQPHWSDSCVDLPVSYKGGCTVSCPNGNCAENCIYSFRIQNQYFSNEPSFTFFRLSLTENSDCGWYEQCIAGGDSGNYDSCEPLTETCIDSACRTIKGQQLCPACWNRQREYALFYTEDNCQELIDRGCGQIGSKCIKTDSNNVCILLENTFDCRYSFENEVETGGTTTFNCNQDIPCVGDSCFDIRFQSSPDFKQGVTYLAVVDEMAKDIDIDAQIVFPGDNKRCSEYLLDAKSCCGTDSGFLFGCNQEEKELADARDKGVAHFVGSYCATEGIFGICLEKRESYCTFNSVLARIIQQQGRGQLGKGWGSAEDSDCSAFTLEEIQQLNFEAMDFSDFIAELEYNKDPDLDYNPEEFKGNPEITE